MRKLYSLVMIAGLIFSARVSFGQHHDGFNAAVSACNVVRLNLLGVPAFGFEKGIGDNFTVRPEAGLGWPVITQDENSEGATTVTMESLVNPYMMLEGRYYYNLKERFDRGRKIDYYAADYIACFYRYNAYEYLAGFSDKNRDASGTLLRDVQYVGAWWGMQRNLGARQLFYINWSAGPGVKTNWKDYADFSLNTQLSFGLQW